MRENHQKSCFNGVFQQLTTSAISILRIFRKKLRWFFKFFGNFSFVSFVQNFFMRQLGSLRSFWSENRQNPSHPRDFSVVWRFSIFGRALSISHVNYWELWLVDQILLVANFLFHGNSSIIFFLAVWRFSIFETCIIYYTH